jgi:hypothetical protein
MARPTSPLRSSSGSRLVASPATDDEGITNRRNYWQEQITKAEKRYETFILDGDATVDRFVLEGTVNANRDKYNMLYSSTETIKPSLYASTPVVQTQATQRDTTNPTFTDAAALLEAVGQYCVSDNDFDYVLRNAVSDYVLPGLGQVWLRYEPAFAPMTGDDGEPEVDDDNNPKEYLTGERIALDHVNWKDFRTGSGRIWEEVPWVARRVYFTKKQATKRFGAAKANELVYSFNVYDRKDRAQGDNPKRQAVIWEIWDKDSSAAVWYSDDYSGDVLDQRDDPLKVEGFFPCPRPIRAIWTTRDFIPSALYSQYKGQAQQMDRLTERIRYLTEALKVRGLYDAGQEGLVNLLEGPGNKMIPVQDWAQFLGQNGIVGSVQFMPITDTSAVLSQLLQQREVVKNEIYEITGFSDIMRGISKASETLGAQQIKSDWATGRLKDMQREVQRFCRDIVRIMIDIAAEHFNDKSLMLYAGISPPQPSQQDIQNAQAYQQAKQQYPQQVQQAQQQGQPPPPPPQPPPPTAQQQFQTQFQQVVALIRRDKLRCAAIDIETDSTILPDEQQERQDRLQFLSSIGAFLQQAAPMAMEYPETRGMLGSIMMFTMRTFNSSRPLEKAFEDFQKQLEAAPPPPPKPDPTAAAAQQAQIKAQTDSQNAQLRAQTDGQIAQGTNQTRLQEANIKANTEQTKNQQDHEYRLAQLQLDHNKLNLERQKLGLSTLGEERDAMHTQEMDHRKQAVAAANTVLDRQDQRANVIHEAVQATQQAGQQREFDQEQAELQRRHEIALSEQKQTRAAEGPQVDAGPAGEGDE